MDISIIPPVINPNNAPCNHLTLISNRVWAKRTKSNKKTQVLHVGNIRPDNSSILAIETEKPNELSSLWKLTFMACKEQA
jgi:hypothetical protein